MHPAARSIRLSARLRELDLDLLGELRELREHLDRRLRVLGGGKALELLARRLQPLEQLLGPPERRLRLVSAHSPTSVCSLATRPRIPFTSRAASSEA